VYLGSAILAILAILPNCEISNLHGPNTGGRSESRRPRHTFQARANLTSSKAPGFAIIRDKMLKRTKPILGSHSLVQI
jgi:hypothetical protein